jgi:Purple acid Phosphatase, N-terminal domain
VQFVSTGADRGIISWVTLDDEPSDSQVQYGTDPNNMTTTDLDRRRVTNHRVELTGLQPGARYYYRVMSRSYTSDKPAEGKLSTAQGRFYHPTFNWEGFFRPVNNPPSINENNAGSTIPVKFSLDGNQGLDIFAAGFPQSAGAATAGSLSYDAREDQYTYTWRTDKAWSGRRTLVVKLKDNSEHRAEFDFK